MPDLKPDRKILRLLPLKYLLHYSLLFQIQDSSKPGEERKTFWMPKPDVKSHEKNVRCLVVEKWHCVSSEVFVQNYPL